MIRRMEPEDVETVVAIHLKSFPGFFLSFLGPRFLALYYLRICVAAEGISFVCASDTSNLIGFVVGTSNPRGFYSRLLKRTWLQFVVASFWAMIKKPSTIIRLARAAFFPSKTPAGNHVAGLYSIGVLPEYQRIGAGKKLIQAFLAEAKERKCETVYLATDSERNDAVNAFYKRVGFDMERQYTTPEGRKMNEYRITLR